MKKVPPPRSPRGGGFVLVSARRRFPFNRGPESLPSPALPLSYPHPKPGNEREGLELNQHQGDTGGPTSIRRSARILSLE
jgi:hypothetical protein